MWYLWIFPLRCEIPILRLPHQCLCSQYSIFHLVLHMGDLIFYLSATDFQKYVTSSDLSPSLLFGTSLDVNLQELNSTHPKLLTIFIS